MSDLRVFHNAARALTSTLDRDTVLGTIMSQMAQFFTPQSWSLLLVDEQRQDLHFVVADGHPKVGASKRTETDQGFSTFDDTQHSVRIPIGEGMAGWVVAHGEALIVPDVRALNSSDPDAIQFCPAESAAVPFEVHSAISLPLRSRGRTLGVIQLFNYRIESLNDYAITFLHILTDYAAIAIENARAVERIQELTITDDPTGLFNTRHLHTSLQAEFERARRFQTEFSVLFIDLDYFKRVNDEHGHLAGTELLVEVAHLIQRGFRAVDMVFRYGGDEFVALLPQTGKTAAVDAAQRIRHALNESRLLTSHAPGVQISASFGVSTYPQDGDSPEEILHAADARMYSIKHSSRDGVAFE